MITDPWVRGLLNPPKWAEYAVMAFFVAFVCVLSKLIINRRKTAEVLDQTAVKEAAL